MPTITPVLMSGGAGTRLWPLSRRAKPKQFRALGTQRTLIQETALRVTGPLFGPPLVVCNAGHADLVREQLAAVGITPRVLILEPEGRNTGPAAVIAATLAAELDPDGLVLLTHADNRVAGVATMQATVAAAVPAAEGGALVVFGIKPTGPETGYGYIRAGEGEGPVRPVAAFVEKPDLETARGYVADPAYSWNAGLFLFRPQAFLAEATRVAPEMTAAAVAALAAAPVDGDAVVLGEAFLSVPPEAIDTAVFERTDKAAVISANIGWSDVGNYDALWAGAVQRKADNVVQGPVIMSEIYGCLVVTDSLPVVLSGVEDLVVVVDNGVVLVTRRDAPGAVRQAVDAIKAAGREDLL